LFLGYNASQILLAQELLDLWNHGIVVGSTTWRVALVNGVWDGKGFEKATFTQGGASYSGCNACNFPGVRFGRTMVYPWYASYLNIDDKRRSKHPTQYCYNIGDCTLPVPLTRSYNDYETSGSAFLSLSPEERSAKGANVNGVKGIWAFHILPYAEHIHWTKDFMHSGDHLIKDALNLFKKKCTGHVNRSQKVPVALNCRLLRIFPFVYNDLKIPPPWTLSMKLGLLHDVKLKNVIGALSVDVPKKNLSKV